MTKFFSLIILTIVTFLGSLIAEPQTVTIESSDLMQFDVKEFKVKAGSKVKLVFKHVGKLPKTSMGHNVVILKKGLKAVQSGSLFMRGGSPANDYVPESQKQNVVAHTKLIGGGEQDTIEFTAPVEAGIYEYLCTFPGHFAIMNGKMIVE